MRTLLALPFFLLACGGSVRVVERTAQSETIAISGNEETCRSRAHRWMSDHCTQGYTLVDEKPTEGGWKMRYRCNEARDLHGTEAKLETITIR